ncbi:MAG: hypothetical protein WB408_18645, partial [Terracidiphilus sp.]
HQGDQKNENTSLNRFPLYSSSLSNQVDSADVLDISSGFSITGNSGNQSSGTYTWRDSRGGCYSRTIASKSQVLTSVKTDPGCFARNPF